MIPLALAAAAGTARKAVSSVPKEIWYSAAAVGVLAGVYFIGKRIIDDIRYSNTLKAYGTTTDKGLAVAYADRLYSAAYANLFATDEDAVFETAKAMYENSVSFAEVAKAYDELFKRDLNKDLNDDLTTSEKGKFMSLLTSGVAGLGDVITTNRAATVYDQGMNPLITVKPKTKLGRRISTVIMDDKPKAYEFAHGKKSYYVQANDVSVI
jgi:hypothetical protein